MSALRTLSWLYKCPSYWQEPEKGNLCSCLRPFSYWWAFHPFCSKLCPCPSPPAPPPRCVRKGTPSGNPPIVIICVCSTEAFSGKPEACGIGRMEFPPSTPYMNVLPTPLILTGTNHLFPKQYVLPTPLILTGTSHLLPNRVFHLFPFP